MDSVETVLQKLESNTFKSANSPRPAEDFVLEGITNRFAQTSGSH